MAQSASAKPHAAVIGLGSMGFGMATSLRRAGFDVTGCDVSDDAVARFAALDARKAELVKLRYFVGMSFEQAAEVLGIAVPTAKQWWAYSRAWLRVELAGPSPDTAPLP